MKAIEAFYEKYEKHISPLVFVGGFIFDNLTLQRVDFLFDNLVMIFYLIISGGSIVLLNYYHEYLPQRSFAIRIERLLPLFIQFTFGGLFSAFFIFYIRSATFSSSWPFILILLFLFIGNEFFIEHYQKITFQVSIYFLAIFSFFIFFIPVILKTMGAAIFLLSGVISLLFILLFSITLFNVVPKQYKENRTNLRNSIFSIFIIINILYFSNLIPPIPLSLKDAGVYHFIEREGNNYIVIGEKKEWYEPLLFFIPETVDLEVSLPLYVFSSVFAPTDLDTRIIHDWQYFDDNTDKWLSATKITFPIMGGRDEGYRGFSKKENLFEGKWRVDVKTERNQIIGRIRFNIKTKMSEVELKEQIL